MKTIDALRGISAYPIPQRTIEEVATRRNVGLDNEATVAVLKSPRYNLACADLLLWLSYAPSVAQGGQNYSFTDEQRVQMRNRASALFGEFETDGAASNAVYGYKGSRL